MDKKISVAMNLIKQQGKKKIIMRILPIIAPYLLGILGGLFVVLMLAAPIMNAVEAITEFGDKVSVFFEKTANWLSFRGFREITLTVIEQKEEEIADELKKYYDEYYSHGVKLDAPLIAASIYYPMYNVYDEETIENFNRFDSGSENNDADDEYKEQYDYLKKVKKDIEELARNSISESSSEYECVSTTILDAEGNDVTIYVTGNLIETKGPEEFKGKFKSNGTCDKGVKSIKIYTYQNDIERFDNYLKDHYVEDNGFYNIPKNLTGTELEDWKQQTVYQVHDLAKIYYDILENEIIYVSSFSNLCPTGVVVTGSDAGVYNLEDYIAGVVQHENVFQDPKDPNNIEAMKAQAIAARTYLLKYTDNCKKSIVNSTAAQTFSKNPSDKARRAAEETAGMVLTYNGEIFLSEYDSFDCSNLCIGGLDCTCEYYKLPFITASGKVTGDKTRAVNKHVISVPSDFITNNIGGHGRGMSQWGARYMQTQGKTYEEILKYFYADNVQITTATGGENGRDGAVVVENGVFYLPAGSTSGLEGSKGSGPNGFNIFFWNRLETFFNVAASVGHTIDYTDAWRSYSSQERCKIEKPDLCATPGKSVHGWGVAADLNYHGSRAAQDWAHANAEKFGLKFTVCASYPNQCKEPWHIEPINIAYR
ncbi:MAG TPA: hypothetical protein GXZ95_05245 [Mollicutes bacterium]|nr:hypothetical protein [Mollicutes bacterium]